MRHILIVDDAEEIVYLFRRSFEAQRFRVTAAHSGEGALQAIGDDPIDGIVTDFRMLGMNGDELITRIRERQPDVPAIIVTAYSTDLPPQIGNTHVFSKPVSPLMLVYRMTDLLIDVESAREIEGGDPDLS
ncbi:response regulator [Noviherbaspirillum malthae]|uniref:response regulator n=1 Tax=Noviherbaspirillum malthae TaxID=1260987 RepID=UPI0018904F65|nr:response regulator [Noviherbaspirillum malthae]